MQSAYYRLLFLSKLAVLCVLWLMFATPSALAADGASVGVWVGVITGVGAFLISLGGIVWTVATKMNTTALIQKDTEELRKDFTESEERLKEDLKAVEKRLSEAFQKDLAHQMELLGQTISADKNVLVQQLAAFKLEVKDGVRTLVSEEIVRCPHGKAVHQAGGGQSGVGG